MARRVFTEDEVEDLVARALKKTNTQRPDFDRVKEQQDQKILAKELAREKRHRVLEAGTVDEQLDALGGPMALTPRQLLKMRSIPVVPSRRAIEAGQTEAEATNAGPSLSRLVLGDSPASDHLARLREVQRNLHGKGVSMTDTGEIEIDGDIIVGSDMVKSLKYIVKGSRGVRERPPGVEELAQFLRGRVSSSSFPPAIRPLLGGKQPQRKKKSPPKTPLKPSLKLRSGAVKFIPARESASRQHDSDDEVDSLARDLDTQWTLHDDDQEGSGLDLARAQLDAACDHAACGDLGEAWEALKDAKSRGATKEQIRKAVVYFHQREEELEQWVL